MVALELATGCGGVGSAPNAPQPRVNTDYRRSANPGERRLAGSSVAEANPNAANCAVPAQRAMWCRVFKESVDDAKKRQSLKK